MQCHCVQIWSISFLFWLYTNASWVLIFFPCVPSLSTVLQIKIEPRHEISNNVVCVTSKSSDQLVHTRNLIRAFASRLNIL